MGLEGLLPFIAIAVLQNGRLADKRGLTRVLNAFPGLYPLPELTLSPLFYKSTPVEQHSEAEQDIFDMYMDELLLSGASDLDKEYSEGQRLLKKPDNVFK